MQLNVKYFFVDTISFLVHIQIRMNIYWNGMSSLQHIIHLLASNVRVISLYTSMFVATSNK